mmetsp:Transcript_15885/g.43882  ORF Transcript_15885/g.43882 Transcript_15885/m.43882 type:complete len:252 (-) Transcript_15885:176-931(-)|eukprot:CAMPEP_0198131142 /NCGR_PEP_ID=MMETSP1442-20131203/55478_1 /TAXON_ID= /ORGANISM="Craspedostauros australis, Strain CCMP3328" /LENGTH=251 /DNA_ID=CAMNT_0043791893 /DNA_START=6 /DNA_END=761 /DNA_ORIENTATION=-
MKPLRICPFTVGLFVGTTVLIALLEKQESEARKSKKSKDQQGKDASAADQQTRSAPTSDASPLPNCDVVFILGGPGAGKGTQCQMLTERKTDWVHLSAGDLLRAERKTGSDIGELINSKIAAGELVPSSITVQLLRNAMVKATKTKFLIDGFPRSVENMTAWQDCFGSGNVRFVLHFECPEEVLVGRLLERGQTSGRNDDTIDVIRKRFRTFQKETLPVLEDLETKHKIQIHRIASDRPIEKVYETVSALF